jgi:hypothetical protein
VGAIEERAKCCGFLGRWKGRTKPALRRIVVLHGGIVPALRRRALAALRLEEREEISRGIAPNDNPGGGVPAAVAAGCPGASDGRHRA